MRTTGEIRDALEAAARANGRSLAQEVEFRLEQSFREEAARQSFFGGPATENVARRLAAIATEVEQVLGHGPWNKDYETFAAVRDGWRVLIEGMPGPRPSQEYLDQHPLVPARTDLVAPEKPVPPAPLPNPKPKDLLGMLGGSADTGPTAADIDAHRQAEGQHARDQADYEQKLSEYQRQRSEWEKQIENALAYWNNLKQVGVAAAEREIAALKGKVEK